jgi:hypothetical protein
MFLNRLSLPKSRPIPADNLPMTIAPLTFPKTFYGEAPSAADASPLSAAHLAELELAQKRSKKIRRAVVVAQSDAWICAIFAGITLLCSIFSPAGLLLGLAMSFCAFNSFRGAKRLRQFDSSAARLLGLNQLGLAAALIAYAASQLWAASHGHSAIASAAASDPALASALAPFQSLEWIITLAVYGGLIAATVLAQGFTTLYYTTRQKHVVDYVAKTAPWILAMQKAQAGG